MENVFIFSSDVETIKTGYSDEGQKGHGIERVSTLVEERDLVERLRNIYPLGRCFIWGAQETEDNYLLWQEMEAEDFILGVRGRSIISAARILMKQKAPGLAAGVWDSEAGAPFSLICFMDEPLTGEVAIEPSMSRYLDAGAGEFKKLAAEKRDCMLSDYASISNFVRLGLGFDFPFSLRHSE